MILIHTNTENLFYTSVMTRVQHTADRVSALEICRRMMTAILPTTWHVKSRVIKMISNIITTKSNTSFARI